MPSPRSAVKACALVVIVGVLTAGASQATVITPSPVDFTSPEQSLFNGAVATFTDDNPAALPTDFVATVDWGDGSAMSAGSIGESSAAFVVLAQHTYDDEGTFTVTVTISDVAPGTGTANATDTATITEADVLSGTPTSFSAIVGTSVTTPVGTFSDTLTGSPPSDFTATVNWGDATISSGTITGGGGSFTVSGTHTYAAAGDYSVIVTLSDDAPGTATAQVTSTAHVAGVAFAVTGISFTTPEGAAFNGMVATFADSNPGKTAASFTASINWGDGTAATPGTVTGGSTSFAVAGSHTYADEGVFTLSVMVAEVAPGTASGTGTATATVTESDVLRGTGMPISAQQGVTFSGAVATFSDTYAGNVPSDFTATINWGDGATTAGTVSGGSGTFVVSGSHAYANAGPFTVAVTLSDDAPGTATATATSAATVSASLASVPTLDGRGLGALIALLGVAGWFLMRRPRRAS